MLSTHKIAVFSSQCIASCYCACYVLWTDITGQNIFTVRTSSDRTVRWQLVRVGDNVAFSVAPHIILTLDGTKTLNICSLSTHPTSLSLMTASVTTMLNINGSVEETQSNGSVQGLQSIYDYYKLPMVVDGVSKGITLITSDGKAVTDTALQEMVWR